MLNSDILYSACVSNRWCTSATNATYEKILCLPRLGLSTKEIALSIWLVSNDKGETFESIYDKLKVLSRKNGSSKRC